jgi:hypothetical protein
MARIGLPVTPAAYNAVKRIFPNTIGEATVGADGMAEVRGGYRRGPSRAISASGSIEIPRIAHARNALAAQVFAGRKPLAFPSGPNLLARSGFFWELYI